MQYEISSLLREENDYELEEMKADLAEAEACKDELDYSMLYSNQNELEIRRLSSKYASAKAKAVFVKCVCVQAQYGADYEDLCDDSEIQQLWAMYTKAVSKTCECYSNVCFQLCESSYTPAHYVRDSHHERFAPECVATARIIRLFSMLAFDRVFEDHQMRIDHFDRLYHELWTVNSGKCVKRPDYWSREIAYRSLKNNGDAFGAAKELRAYAARGMEIVRELGVARTELAAVAGVTEEVERQIGNELKGVIVPMPSARRPYHLHYLDSPGGGGNEEYVLEVLLRDQEVEDGVLNPWTVIEYSVHCIRLVDAYDRPDFKAVYQAIEHCMRHSDDRSIMSHGLRVCLDSARMEIILGDKLRTAADLADELTLWRAMPRGLGADRRWRGCRWS
jgi:hypothetical protein